MMGVFKRKCHIGNIAANSLEDTLLKHYGMERDGCNVEQEMSVQTTTGRIRKEHQQFWQQLSDDAEEENCPEWV
jgi:hypothetical protein